MPITKATQNVVEGIVSTGSAGVSAGSFKVGQQYKITSLGTTTQSQWNTIAGTTGQTYVVGSLFTAATDGSGSGNGAAAVARTLANRFADVVNVKDFGVVGDGVADDYTAIINAAALASNTGATLLFDGSKTYLFGLTLATSQITFPPNLRIKTNGATFIAAYNTTSNSYSIQVNQNSYIDELNIVVPTGVRRDRCLYVIGSNTNIHKISVTSIDVQTTTESNDAGVRIQGGSLIDIGTVNVTNYDRSIIVATTNRSYISAINITNYVRGLWMFDNVDLTIGQTSIKTRSPNASNLPGHNGILMSCNAANAQRNITINSATVEDSGEHGIRVGGDFEQINITFNNPYVYNCGNCGIKLLGTDTNTPTSKNKNIIINSPVIENCGTSASAASNKVGILIEHIIGCQVVAPIIRTRNNAKSASYGIYINASSFINITNPIIEKAEFEGIIIDNRTTQSTNEHITVDGGQIVNCGQDGIRVYTQDTYANNFVIFNGTNLIRNGGVGFNHTVFGSGNPTQVVFRVQTQLNTGGIGISNTIRTILDGIGSVGGTPLSGIVAQDGSIWNDGLSLNIRKGGAWVAL
jgi:hypothetical protein